MFDSLKVLRKEKKMLDKKFSYVWFHYEKYERKQNIIKKI